jgi:hypothetical protein
MTLDLGNVSLRQARIAFASLVVMIILGACNLFFSYGLYWQRIELQAERNSFEKQALMNRSMLDARAVIFTTLIQAASENRGLTAEEKTRIDRLWIAAELDIDKRPR